MITKKGKHRNLIRLEAVPSASPVAQGSAEKILDAMSGSRAEKSGDRNTKFTKEASISETLQANTKNKGNTSAIQKNRSAVKDVKTPEIKTFNPVWVETDAIINELESSAPGPMISVRRNLETRSWIVLVVVLYILIFGIMAAAGYLMISQVKDARLVFAEKMNSVCTKENFEPYALEHCVNRAGAELLDRKKELFSIASLGFVATIITTLVGYFVYKGGGVKPSTSER